MQKPTARPDAIRKACDLLDCYYVKKLMAPDMETFERWQSNSLTRFREGYRVREMRSEHKGLVDDAFLEWQVLESPVLGIFDGSREKFAEWFSSLHTGMWRDKELPICIQRYRELGHKIDYLRVATSVSRQRVNYKWCISFSALLPLAIPDLRRASAEIGMMMSSIYYLELIAKERDRNEREGHESDEQVPLSLETFEPIDSCWRRAKELSQGNDLL